MNTFLPVDDFKRSAEILDFRRLGKQRVEAFQIVKSISEPQYGWKNHPASKMWKNYLEALKLYTNYMIEEWCKRGYKNSMRLFEIDKTLIVFPAWLGNHDLHRSHRSNLLRKDFNYYSKFNWTETPDLPYVWPGENFLHLDT